MKILGEKSEKTYVKMPIQASKKKVMKLIF